MATSQDIVKQTAGKELVTIESFIKKNEAMIKRALNNTISPERFLAVINIVMQSPALQGCSQNSLVSAVLQTVQIGLTPGPVGHVYYVPFYKGQTREVQMIVGYRGLVELINRSKEASVLSAFVVYEKDQFQYEQGFNPVLRHIPADGDRGPMIGVYCIAKIHLANEKVFVYIQKAEVEKVKTESLNKIAPDKRNYSPWVKWEESMWMKTAVRRIAKLLPLSVEVQRRISADETVKTAIVPNMADAQDHANWDAQEAEIVPQEQGKPEQQASKPDESKTEPPTATAPLTKQQATQKAIDDFDGKPVKRLIEMPIGSTLTEGDFLVHGVEFKGNIGKNGKSTIHCEDTQGQEYYIDKWGEVKDAVDGQICTILLIKVGEYQGKRKYMADKIVLK